MDHRNYFKREQFEMSKLQRSFLKYIKRKPSFKDIMLCSALLALSELFWCGSLRKFLDENVDTLWNHGYH